MAIRKSKIKIESEERSDFDNMMNDVENEIEEQQAEDWRKRSIPTHSGWLYPLTFDAGKGLKEA